MNEGLTEQEEEQVLDSVRQGMGLQQALTMIGKDLQSLHKWYVPNPSPNSAPTPQHERYLKAKRRV